MITIKEIAKMAGVSEKTAERALSGVTKDKRSDARERAERVRKIAREHGYMPSELALALRRGRSGAVGMVVDILTDQFLAAAVETAVTETAKAGYKITLQIVRFSPEQTREAIQTLLASGAEGIITSCTSSQLPQDLINSLVRRNYPLFSLCERSCFDISSASPDYSAALPQALQYLVSLGHRKVTLALFKGKENDNERTGRIFTDSCAKLGIEPDLRIHENMLQAEQLANEKIPAVILYGKYSMRRYLDRCAKLKWQPDIIGIYNEWTAAAAQDFALRGMILENARTAVISAVEQIFARINGGNVCNLDIPARFVPENELHQLQLANLANQYLTDDSSWS